MNWQQVCEDPNLQNLPYKIELIEGDIFMSPVRVDHALYAAKIQKLLLSYFENGAVPPEFPVEIRETTRVPDVCWISEERQALVKGKTASSIAPEICVEVASPSDIFRKLDRKMRHYFSAEAQECWICDKEGNMRFFSPDKELEGSELVPEFPQHIEI